MRAGRFDKTARLLHIQKIPGGPELEKLAAKGQPRFELPVRAALYPCVEHRIVSHGSFVGSEER